MLANYIGAVALVVIGFYAMAMKRDIIDRNYAQFLMLPRQKPIIRDTFTEAEI